MRAVGVALVIEAMVALIALGAAGCAGELERPERFLDGGTGGGGCNAEALLRQRCGTAGCHGASRPSADLDLASSGVASRLRNRASTGCGGLIIDATTPVASLLLDKISDQPSCGDQMPPGTPLGTSERACLTYWINAVASGGAQ